MAGSKKNKKKQTAEPEIVNRKARHLYAIEDTLECGVRLTGTEVKAVRNSQISLGEGYVRADMTPLRLTLIGVHIGEYENASKAFQHKPTRPRELLAHKREMKKIAAQSQIKGMTLVPLKVYFKNGFIKVQIGVAKGKSSVDKRQDIRERETKRDIDRAMSKRV